MSWIYHTYHEYFVITFRLLFAFVVGAIMGLERERYHRANHKVKTAGFRTYSLVTLGSCIFGLFLFMAFLLPVQRKIREGLQHRWLRESVFLAPARL